MNGLQKYLESWRNRLWAASSGAAPKAGLQKWTTKAAVPSASIRKPSAKPGSRWPSSASRNRLFSMSTPARCASHCESPNSFHLQEGKCGQGNSLVKYHKIVEMLLTAKAGWQGHRSMHAPLQISMHFYLRMSFGWIPLSCGSTHLVHIWIQARHEYVMFGGIHLTFLTLMTGQCRKHSFWVFSLRVESKAHQKEGGMRLNLEWGGQEGSRYAWLVGWARLGVAAVG